MVSPGFLEALSLLFIGYLGVLSIAAWVTHKVQRMRRRERRGIVVDNHLTVTRPRPTPEDLAAERRRARQKIQKMECPYGAQVTDHSPVETTTRPRVARPIGFRR